MSSLSAEAADRGSFHSNGYRLGGVAHVSGEAGRHASTAWRFSVAHVVADPLVGTPVAGHPRLSTGTAPSRSASMCGISASASPRRWTPRSAAWGWTGDLAGSIQRSLSGEGKRQRVGVSRRGGTATSPRMDRSTTDPRRRRTDRGGGEGGGRIILMACARWKARPAALDDYAMVYNRVPGQVLSP